MLLARIFMVYQDTAGNAPWTSTFAAAKVSTAIRRKISWSAKFLAGQLF
jgi:hypothetical protein